MNKHITGLVAGRLSAEDYADNFKDLHPPLDKHEALVAADRCYFCHDAPCVTACPTAIDIPMFIRQIATDNVMGSAKTIFDQNIFGGMCARVCPTETLCEQACVREEAEGKPVKIGELQRYATDAATRENVQFYERAPSSGKSVAVLGAGPAGLACAHRLAMHGHEVTVFDAAEKPGGLNEFGIATYKTVDDFAQAEVDYITAIGGIAIEHGKRVGRDVSLSNLMGAHDAVFIGIGLSSVNDLALDNAEGAEDAVDFIARLRQATDKSSLPVGRRVVVIGGGMTAVDAAVQAKLLGAEEVTICYRGPKERMSASEYEQDLATSKGVAIRHWLQPHSIATDSDAVNTITFEYTEMVDDRLTGTGETITLAADHVLRAIGQQFDEPALSDSLTMEGGRIATDDVGKTSLENVWAGGDCTNRGDDLTVTAVAQGRDAAEAIHTALAG